MVRQLNDLDPVNEVKGYSKLRDILRRTDRATGKSNLQRLYQDLHESGYVEGLMDDGQLTTGNKPFNVFAKVSMGLMPQKASEKAAWKGTEEENKKLGQYEKKFMVACNREENDINWESDDNDWKGKVISDANPRQRLAFSRYTHRPILPTLRVLARIDALHHAWILRRRRWASGTASCSSEISRGGLIISRWSGCGQILRRARSSRMSWCARRRTQIEQ